MPNRKLVIAAVATLLLIVLGPGTLLMAPASAAGPTSAIAFHPVNPNYARIKASIDAHAPRGARAATPVPLFPPSAFVSKAGLAATSFSPSDANGAIGPTEYIETVNTAIGVYDRNLNLLSSTDQATWTGFGCASGDAAVMYSAHDHRFYASLLCLSSSSFKLIYGFSKGSAPSASNADWCFYTSTFGGRYGLNLPDYPKLGDSSNFILMGVNTFSLGLVYIGSDVAWVQKPPAGTLSTCPTGLKQGVKTNLKNADGTLAATPNPMKQADSTSTGIVVANEDPGSGTSSVLTAYRVTNSAGSAVFSAPIKITVPAYAYPPSAPQPGTTDTLDTLDARLNSGWVWKDPSGVFRAVTGHTVRSANGAAEYRYYILTSGSPVASGVINDPNLYVFMGAIAPDRNAAAATFGSNVMAVFNTSSGAAFPSVAAATYNMTSKAQSSIVNIFTSPAADTDFTCTSPYGPPCRWGDYSGASPDPASSTGGQVWGTGMTSHAGSPGWGSWNLGALP